MILIFDVSLLEADSFIELPNLVYLLISAFILAINSIGLKASGAQSEEGFIVFKGSQSSEEFKKASSQSLRNKWNELRNQKIVDQGVFLKDIIFSSPSTAAAMVLGRNSNGLTQWKNRDGKTLKENMNKE